MFLLLCLNVYVHMNMIPHFKFLWLILFDYKTIKNGVCVIFTAESYFQCDNVITEGFERRGEVSAVIQHVVGRRILM